MKICKVIGNTRIAKQVGERSDSEHRMYTSSASKAKQRGAKLFRPSVQGNFYKTCYLNMIYDKIVRIILF